MYQDINIKADYREKPSGIPDLLIKRNINNTITTLPVGDYIINEQVTIERKSNEDFVLSIINNRIFEQCSRLKRNSVNPIFIIEGNPYKTSHNINSKAIKGAIISISVSWQIPVLFSKNIEDTFEHIIIAGNQITNNDLLIRRKGYKPKRIKNRQLYFLQGLPFIGTLLAKRLIDHFGNIESIINASIQELMQIEGIGNKTANQIKEFIKGS
ncbi:MAG: hypothetical protein K8R58_13400 [Bacteroidales bacterium]|nr:hypothetical protein [Bacteroidales bacterium]